MLCTIAAGWGSSLINLTVAQGAISATSSLINNDAISPVTSNHSKPEFLNRFQTLVDESVDFHQPMFPAIPIEVDVEWAEYLNPYVPSANTSVLDFLLKYSAHNGSKLGIPDIATEMMISGLVANGLARSGFTSKLQGRIKWAKDKENYLVQNGSNSYQSKAVTVPDSNLWLSGNGDIFTVDSEESKDWVKLRVDSTIQGYAYNMDGPAPKVAVAFLLAYCCLALSHFFYSGISGITSIPTLPHVIVTTLTKFIF